MAALTMRAAGLALAAAVAAAAPAGGARAQNEELCGMIAGTICNGGDLGPCFQRNANWDYVPPICTGFVQTLIEMEREAMQTGVGRSGSGGYGGGNSAGRAPAAEGTGYSFGGVLRNGPGMEYGRVGSLQNGDWLAGLEATGVWTDGYQWYYVASPAGDGFHWGGIFCSEQYEYEGVLQVC